MTAGAGTAKRPAAGFIGETQPIKRAGSVLLQFREVVSAPQQIGRNCHSPVLCYRGISIRTAVPMPPPAQRVATP